MPASPCFPPGVPLYPSSLLFHSLSLKILSQQLSHFLQGMRDIMTKNRALGRRQENSHAQGAGHPAGFVVQLEAEAAEELLSQHCKECYFPLELMCCQCSCSPPQQEVALLSPDPSGKNKQCCHLASYIISIYPV